jgi:septum formation protein
MRTLVLASTSPYRLQLMRQLELSFHVAAPTYKERMESNVFAEGEKYRKKI